MGKALYRKYRPTTLAEVAGQPHITGALERALSSGSISHAYLFTGPRGVGKTSVARILAYQVNGLPYDESGNHLDIIEIDAASNRGIEDVRELRDKIAVAPTSAKYKVYIIDEVHMLTTPAFNALLKTLEEPPEHALFILATTEAHKVPETIISRTQHYAFRPISTDSIVSHLKTIAKTEGIPINDEALGVLAIHGGGSFRDSIGLLDQVRHSNDEITADDVRSIFGIAPESAITSLVESINSNDAPSLYATYLSVIEQGITASALAAQLAEVLRADIRTNTYHLPPKQTLRLLARLIDVAPSPNPDITLEVILLGEVVNGPVTREMPHETPKPPISTPSVPKDTHDPAPLKISDTTISEDTTEDDSAKLPKLEKISDLKVYDGDFNTAWQEVLLTIKKTHYTLYGVLRMAHASLESSNVTLCFQFKLHQKKVTDPKNKEIISKAIKTATGQDYSITCVIGEIGDKTESLSAPAQPQKTEDAPSENPLSTISNIFGGGELLES